MLSPDWLWSPLVLGGAFVLLLAGLAVNATVKDRREFARFSRLRSSKKRRRILGKWLRQSFLIFGGSSAVTLFLSWQYVPLVLADINDWTLIVGARGIFDANPVLSWSILIGLVVALVTFAVWAIIAARSETDEIPAVGDIQAMLPRNRAELPYGAALSINAGIVEELLFRLAMPAMVFAFTGNALVAVLVSVLVFGLLHAYQGPVGVFASAVMGAIFMAIYIGTGSIAVAIIVHALFDLRSLVLIPIVINRVHLVGPTGGAPARTPPPVKENVS